MNLDNQNSNAPISGPAGVKPAQKHSFKKIMLVAIVISVVFLIAIILKIITPVSTENPVAVLERSWNNLLQSESFVAKFTGVENEEVDKFEIVLNYHKNSEKMSEVELVVEDLVESENNIIKMVSRWNKENLFLLFDYNNSDNLTREINRIYPQLLFLETYKILQPVIAGDRWLHISIPPGSEENMMQSANQLSDEDVNKIIKSAKNAIVIRSYDKNYKVNDKKYHRIIVGLSKEKLISFFESLKDYNLDIKLSDINSIIDSIEETDNWDVDMAEILIDNNSGNFYKISFMLPEFQENTKKEVDKGFSLGTLTRLFFEVEGEIKNVTSEDVYYEVGDIIFSRYNGASSIIEPKNSVEFQDVFDVASKEVYQILNLLISFSINEDGASGNYSFNMLYSKQFYADGNYNEAIVQAEIALDASENSEEAVEAHYWIGLPNYKLGNVEVAKSEYEKALFINPEHVPSLSSMASVYMRYNEFDKAIASAKKAISLDSTYAWAYSNLGIAYSRTERFFEAIKETQTAIEIAPEVPDFHLNLGSAHAQIGDVDKAIEEYKKAIELDSKFEKAYYGLGLMYGYQGKLAEKVELFEYGINNIPESSVFHYELALVYNELGKLDIYEKEMKFAIEINKQYSDAYFSLFSFYVKFDRLDDFEEIVEEYFTVTGKSKEELKREINMTEWMPDDAKEKVQVIIDEII
ncbi:MAG: tetratricopeptide repeat protein [Candidatus Pacebacteria bacterium]|nr:tetratricopeptide repeat protein [Candidatus Paceibacterota bacterium]